METINDLNDFLTGIAKKKDYPKGFHLSAFNRLDAEGAKALAIALQSG